MEVEIPTEPKKPKTFKLCERTDLTMKQVVKERHELIGLQKNKGWTYYVVELIERRLRYLEGRIVEEYLEGKTQEKLISILSKNYQIKIYPRGYPPSGAEQGHLSSHTVCTSEEEGQVTTQTPFCIGYIVENEDKVIFNDHYCEFSTFIDNLYEHLFHKKKVTE